MKRSLYIVLTIAFSFSILIFSGCESEADNTEPEISSLTAVPDEVYIDSVSTITCTAMDEDEDDLTYLWEADGGTFENETTNPAIWTAPSEAGTYTITCTVSDGEDEISSDVDISVREHAFSILANYLVDNDLDLDDLLSGWIMGAADVVDTTDYTVPDYYVMDIRSAEDFTAGHIKDAVNSSLGNILVDATDADNPILVVCYTGQSAGHAVMALRLSGYSDAKVLKFGMSSWHGDFDKWTVNIGSLDHSNWIAAPGYIAANTEFSYPVIGTTLTEGDDILTERVAAMLSGGFKGVGNTDVLNAPDNYFTNNYWDETDVTTYGNISGVYRIKPLTLENEEFMYLDPDETVVTYCWTGQTSSMITAYLSILGYDATSLKFGANGIIYDDLEGHKWTESADYEYAIGD